MFVSLLLPKPGSSAVKMCTRCVLGATLWLTCRLWRLTVPFSRCFVSLNNLNESPQISVRCHHCDFYRSFCSYHLRLCCETSPLDAKTQETLIFLSKTEGRRSLLCPATPRYSLNPPLEPPFAFKKVVLKPEEFVWMAKTGPLRR